MFGFKKFMCTHPLLIGLLAFIIGYSGINYVPIYNEIILRIVLSIIMLGIMFFFGSKKAVKCEKETFKESFVLGKYIFVVSIIFFLIQLVPIVMSMKNGVSPSWFINLVNSIVLCIFVGVFEESLFRGIIFSSFIEKLGSTKKGIIISAIISSCIFGFIHVVSFFLMGTGINVISVTQALLKTLQSGMLGFFLATIYLKTKNIWGISLIHAINNMFLISASAFLASSISTGSYVFENKLGLILIGVYIFTCLISIPFVTKGLKIVNNVDIPVKSIFHFEKNL